MLPWLENDDPRRCQARSRRQKWQQCKCPALRNQKTCRTHGSRRTYPEGRSAPNFKTGEFSAALKKKQSMFRRDVGLIEAVATGTFCGSSLPSSVVRVLVNPSYTLTDVGKACLQLWLAKGEQYDEAPYP